MTKVFFRNPKRFTTITMEICNFDYGSPYVIRRSTGVRALLRIVTLYIYHLGYMGSAS